MDFEAYLLLDFQRQYGCAPIKNSQIENRRFDYTYMPSDQIRAAYMIGKGMRYEWSIKPMPSSPAYDDYWKTHS